MKNIAPLPREKFSVKFVLFTVKLAPFEIYISDWEAWLELINESWILIKSV